MENKTYTKEIVEGKDIVREKIINDFDYTQFVETRTNEIEHLQTEVDRNLARIALLTAEVASVK